jgi:anti-anti-sigma factor
VRDTCIIALPTATIRTTELDAVSVVEVAGDVDMPDATKLGALLAAIVDRGPAGLVVDLSGTAFFYSAGINALISATKRARDRGVAMTVVAAHRAVLRPLQLTGLAEVLTIRQTLDQALAEFRVEREPQEQSTATG